MTEGVFYMVHENPSVSSLVCVSLFSSYDRAVAFMQDYARAVHEPVRDPNEYEQEHETFHVSDLYCTPIILNDGDGVFLNH